ncbi:MAG: C45 family autoproteolytic acyltransferase/hydrolase [Candidatus Omnitrophota bacterium]
MIYCSGNPRKVFSAVCFFVITWLIIPGACSSLPAAEDAGMKLASEFEGGKLYQAGKIPVVVMKGNFYQMGRQYGFLLKKELNEFYEMAVTKYLLGEKKLSYEKVLTELREAFDQQPFYVKEWVRGMGETSGLGLDKQIIQSYVLVPVIMGGLGCSGLFTWGEYTVDGSSVVARNWDMSAPVLEPYQKFLTVAVFNPVGFGQGVADINYAGQITWQSAMNQSGLFYDLQNGSMSDPYETKNRLNSNSALMTMMLNSTSLEQADAFFNSTRSDGGLIINVADAKQGYSYEWGTFDYRRRVDNPKGLMADTNNYVDPGWPVTRELPDGQPSAFTKERRANLLALGEKNKGKIDAGKMMEIFDIRIPNGGPTFPAGLDIKTYYSIVAVPKELKFWLQVAGLQKWIEIDLKPLFESPVEAQP